MILPPLLTIVILLWIGNTIQKFVLSPVEWGSRQCIVWFMNRTDSAEIEKAAIESNITRPAPKVNKVKAADVSSEQTEDAEVSTKQTTEQTELNRLAAAVERIERQLLPTMSLTRQQPSNDLSRQDRRFNYEDEVYVKLPNGEWIPAHIVDQVREYAAATGIALANTTARGYYDYYVEASHPAQGRRHSGLFCWLHSADVSIGQVSGRRRWKNPLEIDGIRDRSAAHYPNRLQLGKTSNGFLCRRK